MLCRGTVPCPCQHILCDVVIVVVMNVTCCKSRDMNVRYAVCCGMQRGVVRGSLTIAARVCAGAGVVKEKLWRIDISNFLNAVSPARSTARAGDA